MKVKQRSPMKGNMLEPGRRAMNGIQKETLWYTGVTVSTYVYLYRLYSIRNSIRGK
jgi:hypothetical protein